jgi:hypothetical protein
MNRPAAAAGGGDVPPVDAGSSTAPPAQNGAAGGAPASALVALHTSIAQDSVISAQEFANLRAEHTRELEALRSELRKAESKVTEQELLNASLGNEDRIQHLRSRHQEDMHAVETDRNKYKGLCDRIQIRVTSFQTHFGETGSGDLVDDVTQICKKFTYLRDQIDEIVTKSRLTKAGHKRIGVVQQLVDFQNMVVQALNLDDTEEKETFADQIKRVTDEQTELCAIQLEETDLLTVCSHGTALVDVKTEIEAILNKCGGENKLLQDVQPFILKRCPHGSF